MVTRAWIRGTAGAGLVSLVGLLPAGRPAAGGAGDPCSPTSEAAEPAASQEVARALGRGEHAAALRAANAAYALALGQPRWDALVCAGDLYRRVGRATGLQVALDAKAGEAYRKALFRARQQASVEGVLRVTEAHAALGDEPMVILGLEVASRLAARDREAQAEVRIARARILSVLAARDVPR